MIFNYLLISGRANKHVFCNFRPCSQIDEEIEDLDDVGGAGDDSEITCINSLEIKQVNMNIINLPC